MTPFWDDPFSAFLTDTTRAGNVTSYAYDTRGRLITITEPGPASSGSALPHISIGYDTAGNLTSTIDERGHATLFTHDLAGRVLTTQDPIQVAAGVATHYAYDPDGKLLSITDALNHVTSFTYDARDEVVTMTDAVHQGTGIHASYSYDAVGNLTAMTDLLGHTTNYAFDNENRWISTTDALNETTSYTYDPDGELFYMTDARNNSVSYDYNNHGEISNVHTSGYADPTGPDPYNSGNYTYSYQGTGTASATYDDDGNLATATDPLNQTTTYAYNLLNLLTGTTDALGHTTGMTYDADLNKATVVDGLGHTTTMVYDSRDRLISQTDPAGGGTTSYTYDDANNLLSVTDPVGNVTSYTYDAVNRRATETMPTGGVTHYTYDVVGNLVQKIDPLGRITDYGYDADNRETTEQWLPVGGGTPTYTMTLTYDAAGNVASVQDNFSEYTYTYDAVNRVTAIDNAGTPGSPQVALTYGYDADGNRTSLSDSLGGTDTYGYDQRNQLDLIAQSGTTSSSVAPELAFFNYDQAGNLTSLTRYADLAANNEVAATTYAYDDANRLTNLTHQTAGGSTIASYAYTLDAANRLTSEDRTWNGGNSSDTVTYGYTANNQLTAVNHTNSAFANESFSYDDNGNRNAPGQTTSTGNEVQSDGTYNYAYDADGNQISKTSIATGDSTTYQWDYRNRLVEVDTVSGGTTTVVARFVYDALNRQIEEVDNPNGTPTTRWTVYDGQTPLLDFNGSGTLQARYLSVPGAIDELLARQTTSGVAWYLDDREGSVKDIADNSGTVLDHVDYGVYGTLVAESSPSNGDRIKYASMEYDAAIGLYSDRDRYYEPEEGRFVSEDILSFVAGDENLYRYCFNDSPNGVDTTGDVFFIPIIIGIGIIGGAILGAPGTAHAPTVDDNPRPPSDGQAPTGKKFLIICGASGAVQIIKFLLPSSTTGKFNLDDIFNNPNLLFGKSPSEVEGMLAGSPGWRIETLGRGGHAGQGWVFRQYGLNGQPTGSMLRWHPGGGHHGSNPYWTVINCRSQKPPSKVGPDFPPAHPQTPPPPSPR